MKSDDGDGGKAHGRIHGTASPAVTLASSGVGPGLDVVVPSVVVPVRAAVGEVVGVYVRTTVGAIVGAAVGEVGGDAEGASVGEVGDDAVGAAVEEVGAGVVSSGNSWCAPVHEPHIPPAPSSHVVHCPGPV